MLENTHTGYIQRLVFILLLLVVGRTGEVALSSWKTAYWDFETESLCFDWTLLKNARVMLMSFFPDAEEWIQVIGNEGFK